MIHATKINKVTPPTMEPTAVRLYKSFAAGLEVSNVVFDWCDEVVVKALVVVVDPSKRVVEKVVVLINFFLGEGVD